MRVKMRLSSSSSLLHSLVLAQFCAAFARKIVILHFPKSFSVIESDLFASFDVPNREKSELRKAKVLVVTKDANRNHVRLAQVVEKTRKVSDPVRIHAKGIFPSSQDGQVEQV